MCDDKFGGCKKSFSWLAQKVSKKIDAYGDDADDFGMYLRPWPWDVVASRQDISTPFRILIDFKASESSYSIRFIVKISRIFDSLFDSNDIADSSHPYFPSPSLHAEHIVSPLTFHLN